MHLWSYFSRLKIDWCGWIQLWVATDYKNAVHFLRL